MLDSAVKPVQVFEDSEFQKAIFDCISKTNNNLLINAKAGSGKTTTIVRSLKLIPENQLTIFLAFNKDIVTELKTRTPKHVYVATLHSWGWAEIKYRYGKNVILDKHKISKIIQRVIPTWGIEENEIESYANRVEQIVDMMRFAMPTSREHVVELCEKYEIELLNGEIDRAKEVLLIARADTKTFDFVDQIYFPAWNPTFKCRKFKYVFIDECQDLNAMQHALLKRLVDPNGGRLVAVGDPNQSIYGFAGADVESFDKLRTLLPNTVELPLSFSYRCGRTIIEHSQQIVPTILPSPTASEGCVREGSYKEVKDGDFVLCRNTRPLVSLCLKYIAEGRKATIKGGDIGKNLINMIKKSKAQTQEPLFNALEKERVKLVEKTKKMYPFKDAEKIPTVVNMTDKIDALKSIGLSCKTKSTSEMISVIEGIFADDNTSGIVLSTMHKSKGLEADNVFIIEAQLIPAVYATQEWQRVQESNLEYVARTRAKKNLIYVSDFISGDERMMKFLKAAVSQKLAA